MDRGQTLSLLCLSKVKMPLWNLIGRGKKRRKKEKRTPVADSRRGRSRGATEQLQTTCESARRHRLFCNVQSFFFFFLLLWDKHGGAR